MVKNGFKETTLNFQDFLSEKFITYFIQSNFKNTHGDIRNLFRQFLKICQKKGEELKMMKRVYVEDDLVLFKLKDFPRTGQNIEGIFFSLSFYT